MVLHALIYGPFFIFERERDMEIKIMHAWYVSGKDISLPCKAGSAVSGLHVFVLENFK